MRVPAGVCLAVRPMPSVDVRLALTAAAIAASVGSAAAHLVPTVASAEITSWALLAAALAGVVVRFRDEGGVRAPTGIEWAVAALVAAGLGALLLNGGDPTAAQGLLRMVQHATILVAVASLPLGLASPRVVVAALLIGGGVQVAVALVELALQRTFFYSLWKPLEAATWQGFVRLGSTPADPNYLALGLVALLPLVLVAGDLWPRLRGWPGAVLAGLYLVVIGFTFSRAGYIGLLILPMTAALLIGPRRLRLAVPRLRPAVVAVGVVLMVLVLVGPVAAFLSRLGTVAAGSPDASMSMRFAAQHAAVLVFAEHPVVGIGFDRFVSYGPPYLFAVSGFVVEEINVLNSFLLVAAESGIIGLTAFTAATVLAVRTFVRGYGRWRDGPAPGSGAGRLMLALAVGLIAWSVMSLTLDGIHSPVQWVLLGLAAFMERWERARAAGSVHD